MRHRKAHRKLGRHSSARKALFRSLLTHLVLNDRIDTTLAKAKELKPLADKVITVAKLGTLASRRRAFSLLQNRVAVQKLFSVLSDRFRDRSGGYTRVLPLGWRHGDSAPMAIVEYVTADIGKPQGRKPAQKTA